MFFIKIIKDLFTDYSKFLTEKEKKEILNIEKEIKNLDLSIENTQNCFDNITKDIYSCF